MPDPIVEMRSDTMTKPTPGMRQAMANAEVGDDMSGEDPTVNRLCRMTAELLGKEDAVFLPSGTMCNQIAFRVWCEPGDEVILDQIAHPANSEAGGPSAMAGASMRPLRGARGIFTAEQVLEAIQPERRNTARSRVLAVENTVNFGGGAVWPLKQLQEVCAAAKEHGLKTHMDGARLMNAVVASGVPASEMAAGFDTAWLDFTKGLGAPLGACLAGSAELIDEAWRYKQMLGGALRQAGIVAAGALYALDHNVERLAEDHANARTLAEGLASFPQLSIDLDSVQTDIVIFKLRDERWTPESFARALAERGLLIGGMGYGRIRAVTHYGIDAGDVEEALEILRSILVA